ncbi:MAG TPA: hypothetical protein PLN53_02070 [Terricaulis sp.]|nr:hypothetical protein [Terricaulis sp.]
MNKDQNKLRVQWALIAVAMAAAVTAGSMSSAKSNTPAPPVHAQQNR